jgi:nucleotide-binding universal stress UspA family protein
MKTLLVPTDFTSRSDRSIHFATRLAGSFNSKLILVNAVYSPVKKGEMILRYKKFLQDEAEYELNLLKESILKKNPALEIETIAMAGETATVVLHCARKSNADLIVMGDKIESDLERMFAGDTVKNVLKKSPCAVFTIPDDLKNEELSKIIFVTEKGKPELKALRLISSVARSVHSGLTLVTDKDGKFTGLTMSAEFMDSFQNEEDFLELLTSGSQGVSDFLSADKNAVQKVTKSVSFLDRFFNRHNPEKLLFPMPLPKIVFPQF